MPRWSIACPPPLCAIGRVALPRGLALECLAELIGAAERRPHGLRQDGPQPARLELMEGRRTRAAWRRDHVAQLGRVEAARLRERGTSFERLDHQVVSDVAREP